MRTNHPELAAAIAALLAAAQGPPAETGPSQTLLTVPETADMLRCGQTMVYELIRDGRLDSVKIGRRWLVLAAAVADSIERGGAAA